MKTPRDDFGSRKQRIRIEKPVAERGENERLWEEVRKYAKLVPLEPDPNMGRMKEIKDDIKKGAYFAPEVIEETAARLAIRFMTRE